MLAAKPAWLPNTVAKNSCAPGARSWTISSIAVPSSPLPACPASTVTAGRSPLAWRAARVLTPSESTPICTPAPLTPKVDRAVAAAWVTSPWEVTEPVLVRASSAARMWSTSSCRESGVMASRGMRARTAPAERTATRTSPSSSSMNARSSGVTRPSISTSVSPASILAAVCRFGAPSTGTSPAARRAEYSSRSSSFCSAGVRVALSRSIASIWATTSGDTPRIGGSGTSAATGGAGRASTTRPPPTRTANQRRRRPLEPTDPPAQRPLPA